MNQVNIVKQYYCECGKIIHRQTALYGSGLCRFCSRKKSIKGKGKQHYNWKGGITKKEYYCKKCSKKINYNTALYGTGVCHHCNLVNRKGETAPTWKGGEAKVKCSFCGKELSRFRALLKTHKNFFCNHNICYAGWLKQNTGGDKSCHWRGGISRDGYPFNFNIELKELIRKRDNYKCQLCGVPQEENMRKLHIHHIDYNKDNLNPKNLISLCVSCHMKTNYNRDHWQTLFNEQMQVNYNAN